MTDQQYQIIEGRPDPTRYYACYTGNPDPEKIVQDFIAAWGYAPDGIWRWKNMLWVGPNPKRSIEVTK